MKNYTYSVNKWGYKIFCDEICIYWAESEHRKGKRYCKKDIEDFTKAAEAHIRLCKVMDKYNNNQNKREKEMEKSCNMSCQGFIPQL